jgi:hypothetical protein
MTDDQAWTAEDQWQSALYEATHRYSLALQELHKTNPWPEHPVLANAINTLSTELWDRCFSASEIAAAFQSAIDGLPSYTAGDDIRP